MCSIWVTRRVLPMGLVLVLGPLSADACVGISRGSIGEYRSGGASSFDRRVGEGVVEAGGAVGFTVDRGMNPGMGCAVGGVGVGYGTPSAAGVDEAEEVGSAEGSP